MEPPFRAAIAAGALGADPRRFTTVLTSAILRPMEGLLSGSQGASVPVCATRRNVELKARAASLEAARAVAQRVATERLGRQQQTDTYFGCLHGRLKLREIDGRDAQLIWYLRPDVAEAKACQYCLAPVGDPGPLKQALAGALGVRGLVEKQRDIYLHHNVRIHLDRVRGLGCFLEFEAVLASESDEPLGRTQLEWLSEQFAIGANDLLRSSYCDML